MLFLKPWKFWGWSKELLSFLTKHLSPHYVYKTYVRPHLEYCIQVWSPFLAGDIDSLEKIQHRTTKLVPYLPYEQRLKLLNLQSLYAWRIQGDLIETYKILNRLTGTSMNNYFTLITDSRYSNKEVIFLNSNRIISCWNSLLDYIRNYCRIK